eukprot:1158541-Pelagomonas_calceolata.AAC.3
MALCGELTDENARKKYRQIKCSNAMTLVLHLLVMMEPNGAREQEICDRFEDKVLVRAIIFLENLQCKPLNLHLLLVLVQEEEVARRGKLRN